MIKRLSLVIAIITAILLTACDVPAPATFSPAGNIPAPAPSVRPSTPASAPQAKPSQAASPIQPGTVTAQVVRVIDGDTIEVNIGGKSYTVRYIGIDTPETVHPTKPVEYLGKEASDKNKELVSGKTARLDKDVSETDKYGRLLRYVYVGDLFINAELVRLGYAQVATYPPDVKYQDLFLKLQREAREAGRGLWGIAVTTAPTQTPTQIPKTVIPLTTPAPTPTDIVYITNTGAKYHRAGCRYLSKSSIPIERKEAISRGYTPCSVCRP